MYARLNRILWAFKYSKGKQGRSVGKFWNRNQADFLKLSSWGRMWMMIRNFYAFQIISYIFSALNIFWLDGKLFAQIICFEDFLNIILNIKRSKNIFHLKMLKFLMVFPAFEASLIKNVILYEISHIVKITSIIFFQKFKIFPSIYTLFEI